MNPANPLTYSSDVYTHAMHRAVASGIALNDRASILTSSCSDSSIA